MKIFELMREIYGYSDSGVTDYTKAIQYYEKAANLGEVEAINNLGDIYYNGNGVEIVYKKAREWYEKGAEKK